MKILRRLFHGMVYRHIPAILERDFPEMMQTVSTSTQLTTASIDAVACLTISKLLADAAENIGGKGKYTSGRVFSALAYDFADAAEKSRQGVADIRLPRCACLLVGAIILVALHKDGEVKGISMSAEVQQAVDSLLDVEYSRK
jgi:hypothetical protein